MHFKINRSFSFYAPVRKDTSFVFPSGLIKRIHNSTQNRRPSVKQSRSSRQLVTEDKPLFFSKRTYTEKRYRNRCWGKRIKVRIGEGGVIIKIHPSLTNSNFIETQDILFRMSCISKKI